MEKQVECLICYRNDKRLTMDLEICDDCLDIMEFGYVSFPAYHMDNDRADTNWAGRLRLLDHNHRG